VLIPNSNGAVPCGKCTDKKIKGAAILRFNVLLGSIADEFLGVLQDNNLSLVNITG
jgi:N-methylhydantoinase A/oxoprolinase/acetone carboxylase beta subunit